MHHPTEDFTLQLQSEAEVVSIAHQVIKTTLLYFYFIKPNWLASYFVTFAMH